MAFSKAWAEDSWRTKKLGKHLPRIDGAGEDELANETQVDDESAEKPTGLMRRIEQKLSEILSTLTTEAEDQQTERDDRLSKLTRDVTRLQAVQDRQSLLLYVVIGLLVWLLIKLLRTLQRCITIGLSPTKRLTQNVNKALSSLPFSTLCERGVTFL